MNAAAELPADRPASHRNHRRGVHNDTDPNTATTLYDLDTTMDQIAIQSPANARVRLARLLRILGNRAGAAFGACA